MVSQDVLVNPPCAVDEVEVENPLIVDFPSEPRGSRRDAAGDAARLVRFSSWSQTALYLSRCDVQQTDLFYSPEECRGFKVNAARDAMQLKMKIAGPSQEMSQEELCNCVGIEKLLFTGGARRSVDKRRSHARVILGMQDRCTPERLSQISWESSCAQQKVAHEFASSYWKDLNV